MRMLVYDMAQNATGIPDALKTPALADISTETSFTIAPAAEDFTTEAGEAVTTSALEPVTTSAGETVTDTSVFANITAVGIGNTDAANVTINGQTISLSESEKTGLYLLPTTITATSFTFSHDGTYLGRLAFGVSRFLGVAPAREPGFYSTAAPRVTASGQVIEGAGGYAGRKIGVDVRYKIDRDFWDDFERAYPAQIGKGYPLFLLFDKEFHRMPFRRFYGRFDSADVVFQSAVNRFLYSRRWDFSEAF